MAPLVARALELHWATPYIPARDLPRPEQSSMPRFKGPGTEASMTLRLLCSTALVVAASTTDCSSNMDTTKLCDCYSQCTIAGASHPCVDDETYGDRFVSPDGTMKLVVYDETDTTHMDSGEPYNAGYYWLYAPTWASDPFWSYSAYRDDDPNPSHFLQE